VLSLHIGRRGHANQYRDRRQVDEAGDESDRAKTKRAAVEACLRKTVQLKAQAKILELRGKVVWRGHDDDWFASDEEILNKRRVAEQNAASETAHRPTAATQSSLPAEVR